MSDPAMIVSMVFLTLSRKAREPCECAARQRRALPGAQFPLKPDHVECDACRCRAARDRMLAELTDRTMARRGNA